MTTPSEEQLVPRPNTPSQRPPDRPTTVAPIVQSDGSRALGAGHHAPPEPKFPSPVSFIIPAAIIAAGYFGMLALGTPEQAQVPPKEIGPRLVETVQVEPYRDNLVIEADGLASPFREIEMAAEVAGRVVYKSPDCRAGNYVKKGTELLKIDPADYELAARQLQNQLHQADVSLQEIDVELESNVRLAVIAEEDHKLALAEVERFTKLTSVVTPSDVDKAKKAELVARNTKATLENQKLLLTAKRSGLEAARELVVSQLEKAKLDLTRTIITAPVDGVIVKEMAEQDGFVQRGSQVLVVEDTNAVEVKCSLEMEQLHWIKQHAVQPVSTEAPHQSSAYAFPQMPVRVEYRVSGRRDETYVWDGTLQRFDGIGVDEKTRTIPCRVVVSNPCNGYCERPAELVSASGDPVSNPQRTTSVMPLVRGMFVTVKIVIPTTRTLLELPERGLRPGDVVWLARDGKLIVAGPVDVFRGSSAGSAQPSKVCWLIEEGMGGIRSGDQVIVSTLTAVKTGDPVTTSSPSPAAPITPTARTGEVAP
ncbi:secretion protein HlyD family protein [Pirellula staleyi DSM 6068]|uniref:Secretion protein HlyD family protein n=1 Tax=Pirellula staleyi (strain ATCC 27377 / DSM 6068 / ICPB 4128) TaxID=530564 RepID=D2R8C0_PIRSD|nr:HlyD family efflux transporter periplasmic adaptor subunit [Pirellula staleyi]ADB15737.1 secretion protein HlyD family protein [Pirellula staleyi DSM 6068]